MTSLNPVYQSLSQALKAKAVQIPTIGIDEQRLNRGVSQTFSLLYSYRDSTEDNLLEYSYLMDEKVGEYKDNDEMINYILYEILFYIENHNVTRIIYSYPIVSAYNGGVTKIMLNFFKKQDVYVKGGFLRKNKVESQEYNSACFNFTIYTGDNLGKLGALFLNSNINTTDIKNKFGDLIRQIPIAEPAK